MQRCLSVVFIERPLPTFCENSTDLLRHRTDGSVRDDRNACTVRQLGSQRACGVRDRSSLAVID